MVLCQLFIALLAVLLGFLSQIDLRLLGESSHSPSQASVTTFYDNFGGILMNDLYHHLFEYSAMLSMLDHCDIKKGQRIVEIGPGSGFLAEQVMIMLNVSDAAGMKPEVLYSGVELSSTMYEKSSARVRKHIENGNVQFNLVDDSVTFVENIQQPVDRFIMTYVMDLMPEEDIRKFVQQFKLKLKDSSSKICLVNLIYGFTPFSRIVTNLWQLIYVVFGGSNVGGCRPLEIKEYFNEKTGFKIGEVKKVVSTGLPSEVAIIHKI